MQDAGLARWPFQCLPMAEALSCASLAPARSLVFCLLDPKVSISRQMQAIFRHRLKVTHYQFP